MKKVNKTKYIIVNLLTSPINILSGLLSILYIIHIRAYNKAQKVHVKIESHENAKIRRK